MFRHKNPVPTEWARCLRDAIPSEENLPRLHLVWMPGEGYEPVQRFVLYELYPVLDDVPEEILGDLKGPSPASLRTKIDDPDAPDGWRYWSPSLVSQLQWQVFGDTGCYPQLFWIVQGALGGHKWRLTKDESALLRLSGSLLRDTPSPGDLPYAPFDNRVVNQLRVYDRLWKWDKDAAWRRENAKVIVPLERAAEKAVFRTELDKWLRAQVEQAVDETYGIWRKLDLPLGDTRFDSDREAVEESFIHDDAIPHTSEVI